MKKIFLCFFSILFLAKLGAQCTPVDTVNYNVVFPLPETADHPERGIPYPACIGLPFNFSLTINTPATFQGFPLDSITMAPMGAISNLPAGIGYVCNPPSCHFKPGPNKGCILLTGTPTGPAGTYDLKISVLIVALGFQFPFAFPSPQVPGNYYLDVSANTADCTSGSIETNEQKFDVSFQPNPADDQLRIQTEVGKSGQYMLDVTNSVGQILHSENVALQQGANEISLETSHLPSGFYFFTLRNNSNQVSRKFSVLR